MGAIEPTPGFQTGSLKKMASGPAKAGPGYLYIQGLARPCCGICQSNMAEFQTGNWD